MHRRQLTLRSLFVAVLAAFPVMLYFLGRHFRNPGDSLALLALLFVVCCAIALRSLIVTGALVALLSAPFGESVILDYFPNEKEVVQRAFLYPIVGALAGRICHAMLVSRKRNSPSWPNRWITRSVPLAATVLLASAFGILVAQIQDTIRWSHDFSISTGIVVGVLTCAWAAVTFLGIRLRRPPGTVGDEIKR
jgi:hypothetical protein